MHLMESLIEGDSIAFELIKYIISDIESNSKKELNIDNMKFTSKTLKYIFGERLKVNSFKEYIILEIKKMIDKKWIIPKGKSMHISEEMIKYFYNID